MSRPLLALAILGALAIPASAQQVVVHNLPLHVRHFSGTVYDARGMTIEYATVEIHSIKDHRLLASTFADGKGAFIFDDKKYGKRVEIRATQKGFNIAQYTAMLRPFGDEHLHIVLATAT